MQTVFYSKTLKANKKCSNIFQGPINILGTEVFCGSAAAKNKRIFNVLPWVF